MPIKNGALDEESRLWIVGEMYEGKNFEHYPIPPTYSVKERIE